MLRQFRLKTWKLTSKNARTHNRVWHCCCPGKTLLFCSVLKNGTFDKKKNIFYFGKVEAINVLPYVDLVCRVNFSCMVLYFVPLFYAVEGGRKSLMQKCN